MILKPQLIIIILTILINNLHSQSPVDGYNKGKGNATIVGSFSNESYSKYYSASGLSTIKRTTQAYNLFGIVGITEKFDAQISVPYIVSGTESSFQDISVYLKYTLLQKEKTKILVAFGQSSPLANYKISGLYALGQQASTLDMRLILQRGLGNNLFVMAQSGYTKRSFPTPSSVPASVKFGYATNKLYVDIWFDYQYAFGGSDYADGQGKPFTTLGIGYSKIGGQVYKTLNSHLGLALAGCYILSGRNVGKATILSGSLIYNL